MRDESMRAFCPKSYDVVIDLIKAKNPACLSLSDNDAETFACFAVNHAINRVLAGAAYCSTCHALAVNASEGEVLLAYAP